MRDRLYDIPAHERDAMIVQLRRRGMTYAAIARRVTESGVRRALARISAGGFGQGVTRS